MAPPGHAGHAGKGGHVGHRRDSEVTNKVGPTGFLYLSTFFVNILWSYNNRKRFLFRLGKHT